MGNTNLRIICNCCLTQDARGKYDDRYQLYAYGFLAEAPLNCDRCKDLIHVGQVIFTRATHPSSYLPLMEYTKNRSISLIHQEDLNKIGVQAFLNTIED